MARSMQYDSCTLATLDFYLYVFRANQSPPCVYICPFVGADKVGMSNVFFLQCYLLLSFPLFSPLNKDTSPTRLPLLSWPPKGVANRTGAAAQKDRRPEEE